MTIAIKDARPVLRLSVGTQWGSRRDQAPSPSEHLAWRQPIDGLWVAETPSTYLGMIERVDDGFIASAADGRTLGRFTAASDAKIAVYASWFRRSETTGVLGWARRILRRAIGTTTETRAKTTRAVVR
ncbi:hypothetical protein KNO15_19595 [Leifsonia shinshuensis]|uniref:hypothetical protein n=1 Tax=Leifsonia shinshuensis TaxID=150026 RepID=UPI001F50CDD6|nr:hypothetical protein [Leifsonia shinshuensis]MCI0158912.1 hypothetical protein [Leifsonia shinshuensis]